jgi:hypothetical protein
VRLAVPNSTPAAAWGQPTCVCGSITASHGRLLHWLLLLLQPHLHEGSQRHHQKVHTRHDQQV